jgi:hypothetical protein
MNSWSANENGADKILTVAFKLFYLPDAKRLIGWRFNTRKVRLDIGFGQMLRGKCRIYESGFNHIACVLIQFWLHYKIYCKYYN